MDIKHKDWKRVAFSLTPQIEEQIELGAGNMGLNKSSFIEFLVSQFAEDLDPSRKIKMLNDKLQKISIEQKKIIEEIDKKTKEMGIYQKIKEEKKAKKPEAIKILSRLMLENRLPDAEKISKNWSGMLGIPALQLLMEAREQLVNSGI